MMPCTWLEEWQPCDTCGGVSEGYDEWEPVRLSVNGQCHVAFSTRSGNTEKPAKFLGNTDPSKPWIVEPYSLFIGRLAKTLYS